MIVEEMNEIGRYITDDLVSYFYEQNGRVYRLVEYRPTTQIIDRGWLSEDDSVCTIDWYRRNPCPNI